MKELMEQKRYVDILVTLEEQLENLMSNIIGEESNVSIVLQQMETEASGEHVFIFEIDADFEVLLSSLGEFQILNESSVLDEELAEEIRAKLVDNGFTESDIYI